MYLEKLEIQGFKSFANKNGLVFPGLIEGDRRGLTAVVGPNGSGKSNIADSVRWALGEQSMKTLRGKKSEDVIFSGSDKKGKLGMAEVSLFFNNDDRQAPLDFSHFVLTRRLYRDGESEYLINNAKVRLLDVQMLLAKANVGQKTYSVIGQGTVEGFLNTSLSERKEFFDEATGVKQFQIKRDDSLNKLRSSLEHLGQAEMLLSEIEPRLGHLTRQVNRLKKRGEIEVELRQFQLAYYRTIWHELNDRFKAANDQLLEAEKDKQLKDKKLLALNSELSALQKQAGVHEEFDRLQHELAELQTKKENLRTELIKIEARAELKLETGETHISKEVVVELQKRLKKSLELLEAAEKMNDLAGIKKSLGQIIKELSELHVLTQPHANNKNDDVKKVPLNLEASEKFSKEITQIDEKIVAIKAKLTSFTSEQEAERQRLFALQNGLQNLQHEINELNNILNQVRVESARQETKLEDLETSIRQDLGGLKEVRDERAKESIDRVLVQDKIFQLKRQMELIGGIDPEIESEYVSTKERHDFLMNQVNDLLETGQSLEQVIEELDAKIKERFDKEFKIISQKFEEYFKILFNGGVAKIIKVMADDENDEKEETKEETPEPVIMSASATKLKRIKYLQKYNATGLAGIEIQATPPGKKIKSITMLSGGERALTAIALICAIISANPSPFVVLDEVDAALDEANSERLAKILDDLSHKTQFIVITHNRASMTRATVLYGVTMQEDGVSKLLSVKLDEAKFNR